MQGDRLAGKMTISGVERWGRYQTDTAESNGASHGGIYRISGANKKKIKRTVFEFIY
jgi:hypothetical protein